MTPLVRRIVFTAGLLVVASIAASAGALLWRHLNPPAVQVTTLTPTIVGGADSNRSQEPQLAVGDRRPDFSLADTEGRTRSIAEWDGKLVFLNFWATWCPPCLEEIPGFMKLQARYADAGVQFLGVALDSPDNVRAFMAEHAVNYPSLHGERDAIALGRRYGNRIGALPYTVVIGRDGRIVRMHQGVLSEGDASALIEAGS
jgi:peroxiredoxin